jgi:trans-aconitate methyltransferase
VCASELHPNAALAVTTPAAARTPVHFSMTGAAAAAVTAHRLSVAT